METRLQKVIAAAGIASRRKAEQMIASGRVKVNGQTVTALGTKIKPDRDRVELDGRPIHLERKYYYLFYKPRKVITSVTDPEGRRVVSDYFNRVPARLFPVGRLDYDTEGLLVVTNDGALAYRMTHPKFELEKSYLALVKGVPNKKALDQLRRGVILSDGVTAPAEVRRVKTVGGNAWIRLTIHEGRNRQIRRMCAAVGHPVIQLKRDRIGFLRIGDLRPGQSRPLTPQEVARLKGRSFT